MADIGNLLQLERHIEDALEKVLTKAGARVYRTRGVNVTISPRVEIVSEVTGILNHVYNFRDGIRWAWDAYRASLVVLIVTNRTDTETRTSSHQRLLGLVRSQFQQFNLCGTDGTIPAAWPSQIIYLTDIREGTTSQRFEDENDLDYSEIRFDLVFNINPAMWEDYEIIIDDEGNVIVDDSGAPILS